MPLRFLLRQQLFRFDESLWLAGSHKGAFLFPVPLLVTSAHHSGPCPFILTEEALMSQNDAFIFKKKPGLPKLTCGPNLLLC